VPPREIRELRDLTRYRKAKIEERTREVQRLDKVLQDAGIKLSSVASEVLSVSGRAMLDALIRGTHDPETLADLAKGKLRRKLPQLREALEGRFTGHHALIVAQMLASIDCLDETVAALSERIEELIAPFSREVELLDTIPGVDRKTAELLLAEIGPDMSRFPSHRHLASWAGLCPGNNESAGKRKSGRTRKGSKWLRAGLTESAKAASRTKGSYLSAHYHRIKGRRGAGKATLAVAHSILVAAYHMLERGVPYQDLGEDYFHRRQAAHGERYTKPTRPPARTARTQGHSGTAPRGRLTDNNHSHQGSKRDFESGHRNVGGSLERNAARIVLRAKPVRRINSLIETPRTKCSLRSSAQRSTSSTSSPWLSISMTKPGSPQPRTPPPPSREGSNLGSRRSSGVAPCGPVQAHARRTRSRKPSKLASP
jgi:hypothetical protein